MAFKLSLGKKKKEEETPAAASPPYGLPIDHVLTMREQGYADNQIVENLQSQGYNSSQILDAMNQAGMSQQAPLPESVPEQPAYADPEQPPNMERTFPTDYIAPVTEKERIEELAEAIIDEKWNELVKDINKVIEWKERTESRLVKIEQSMVDLKMGLESLHRGLMAKISDYDKNISNVGVEIKAMEKVFQKILPSLTENVNRLERMGKNAPSKK